MLLINGLKNRMSTLRTARRLFSTKENLEKIIQEKVKQEEAFFLPQATAQ